MGGGTWCLRSAISALIVLSSNGCHTALPNPSLHDLDKKKTEYKIRTFNYSRQQTQNNTYNRKNVSRAWKLKLKANTAALRDKINWGTRETLRIQFKDPTCRIQKEKKNQQQIDFEQLIDNIK